jgi:hypothetical protein
MRNPSQPGPSLQDEDCERFLSPEERQRRGGGHAARLADPARGVRGTSSRRASGRCNSCSLTGLRRDEIRDLAWPMVDWQHRCLKLVDTKTGPRNMPVSSQVMALLKADSRPHRQPQGGPRRRVAHRPEADGPQSDLGADPRGRGHPRCPAPRPAALVRQRRARGRRPAGDRRRDAGPPPAEHDQALRPPGQPIVREAIEHDGRHHRRGDDHAPRAAPGAVRAAARCQWAESVRSWTRHRGPRGGKPRRPAPDRRRHPLGAPHAAQVVATSRRARTAGLHDVLALV